MIKVTCEISSKLNKVLSVVAIILLAILGALIFFEDNVEPDNKAIIMTYIILAILFMGYAFYLEKSNSEEYVWERNDILGLIMCTVPVSILIPIVVDILLKFDIEVVKTGIILTLFILTVIWFYKKYKAHLTEITKTVQIMTTFITLVGIGFTDMSNLFFRTIFVVMGFTYTIIACVLQNFTLDNAAED